MAQGHFFTRTPADILAEAASHNPVKVFVGFSGGNDSLATLLWAIENIPGCEAFHANTGIGIELTREYVRDICSTLRVPLREIRAKEDCGQDYAQIVMENGFPGPRAHRYMYIRLKERCVDYLARTTKNHRSQRIAIVTGIRYDESMRRMGYVGAEVQRNGGKVWVNPLYWVSQSEMTRSIKDSGIERNPVSQTLGMSGECLCGAFAHKGELDLVNIVCPKTASYIRNLEKRVRAAGHDWGWEDAPPHQTKTERDDRQHFMPFCYGCDKVNSPLTTPGEDHERAQL